MTTYALYNPFGVEEQGWLFEDGWIVVALLDPYRVEWISPEGSRVRYPKLPATARIASEREKVFAVKRDWSWLPSPFPATSDFPAWPSHVPAFVNDALLPLADGRIAIRRMSSRDKPETNYDVVNRQGQLDGTLELPSNSRVLGFGRAHVYVVTRDDLHVERVSRHALPNI